MTLMVGVAGWGSSLGRAATAAIKLHLNVARLAVEAILRIDDETLVLSRGLRLRVLVHPRWAEVLLRPPVDGQGY